MSRSYKRTPVYKDGSKNSKNKKYWKRQANRKIRKMYEDQRKKSNDYKKSGIDTWDICDYRFFAQNTEGLSDEEIDNWRRYFYRK